MWWWPVSTVYLLLQRSSRLCSQSPTLCHVHHSSEYSYILPFPEPPPLQTLNSSFLFILPTLTPALLTFRILLSRSLPGWLPIFTLNPSKTEFLLIGLTKQLAKIHNSSRNTTYSACNLGFIFDEHLTFSYQISSVSKSCYYHIRQLRCIRPYLDSKQLLPLPPPSFIPNLTTVIPSTTTYQSHK